MAYVYRDTDGKVYGQATRGDAVPWYEFYKGKVKELDKHDAIKPKRIITDSQVLFQNVFPDGSKVRACDLVNRKLVTEDAKGKNVKELAFDYDSDGAITMSAAAAPDGTMCGGTAFSNALFQLRPQDGQADEPRGRTASGIPWRAETIAISPAAMAADFFSNGILQAVGADGQGQARMQSRLPNRRRSDDSSTNKVTASR
jgi:hypothetical protein